MIYGYAVLKEESYTNGKPAWREDAWEKDTIVTKVRLFATKNERDNGIRIEENNILKQYSIIERYAYSVKPFETKGSQGKLIIGTKL